MYQSPYPKARNEAVASLLKNTACLKMLLLVGKKKSEGALSHCWEFIIIIIGQPQLLIAPLPLIGELDSSLLSFFWLRAVSVL